MKLTKGIGVVGDPPPGRAVGGQPHGSDEAVGSLFRSDRRRFGSIKAADLGGIFREPVRVFVRT